MIFGHLGFLEGRKATSYPGFEKELRGADVVTDAAVVDGHVITSRGLGTAIEFAAALIALLKDEMCIRDRYMAEYIDFPLCIITMAHFIPWYIQ